MPDDPRTAPTETGPAPAGPYVVTASRVIDAPPARLFDLLADPAQHPRIDGSGTVRATRGDVPARLALGSRFSMDMHLGGSYRITNRVVEFEEGRRIAWRHVNGHRWRWLVDDLGDGRSRVTEQWDARPAPTRLLLRLVGAPAKVRPALAASLDRLAALATAG